MVLDKYKAKLEETNSALDINPEQAQAWHNHPVTKHLKNSLEIAYMNATVECKPDYFLSLDFLIDQIDSYSGGKV